MTTQVLISVSNSANFTKWEQALRERLPVEFELVADPGPLVRHLVTWSPAPDLFDSLPGLQTCFSAGAGVDHVLHNPSLPDGLPIYRLEDAGMAAQMARYSRHEVERIVLRKDVYEAQQQAQSWEEHSAIDPAEVSIGVLGFGVLGRTVASVLAREGYQVSAFRRQAGDSSYRTPERQEISLWHGAERWPAFLEQSQVLVLVAPLTDATRHIINEQSLAALPPGASIINVGRGALIDTQALIKAMNSGHIRSASLDVFETEPLVEADPLWQTPGVRITPHISAITMIGPAATQVAKGIMAFDKGQPVAGTVTRSAGY